MTTKIHSVSFSNGVANAVTIEVSVLPGIGIHLVGLADRYARESLLRTATALQSGASVSRETK